MNNKITKSEKMIKEVNEHFGALLSDIEECRNELDSAKKSNSLFEYKEHKKELKKLYLVHEYMNELRVSLEIIEEGEL